MTAPLNNITDQPFPEPDCVCMVPPIHYSNYTEVILGEDYTNGRYGDVSLKTCIHCQRIWLRYYVIYESFSRSGRWYSGVITPKQAKKVKPKNAVALLESLDWYLYGGSYFETYGRMGRGKVNVDM